MWKKLQDGRVTATAANWPAFLYYGDIPGEDFDPVHFDKGFLRGFILIRVSSSCLCTCTSLMHLNKVLKHIFIAPSSALSKGELKSTRPGNGKLHGMRKVTAEHIAYAAVHVHLHLSYSLLTSVCF